MFLLREPTRKESIQTKEYIVYFLHSKVHPRNIKIMSFHSLSINTDEIRMF